MAEKIYDVCIIGAGMFGSAAARHASANPSIKVCLVGPAEPTEKFPKREIFGSQYDEGRVTRILDDAPPCEKLSQLSICRYRQLEKLSGIKFYEAVGCLFTGPRNSRFMQRCLRSGSVYRVPLVEVSENLDTFNRRYPYLRLNSDDHAFLDDSGGGHINPRNLVAAQKKVARLQGCDIIESVVCGSEVQSDGIHVVKTDTKGDIKAKRILLATGGYVCLNRLDIMPPLLVKRLKETVVLLRIPEEEVQRLSLMPSMIAVRDNNTGAYILPPIKYPDGYYYLKFGKAMLQEEDDTDDELKTLEELRQWYLSDGDREMESYVPFISELIPGLRFDGLSMRTCATCNTPSGLPYIDRVSPTVTVAVAGNGKGAKFSDEVGRIAAHLSLTGQWDTKLEQHLFEAAFR